jgi:hypothetical protein
LVHQLWESRVGSEAGQNRPRRFTFAWASCQEIRYAGFFWGRAGLSTADLVRVLPEAQRRLREGREQGVQVAHASVHAKRAGSADSLVLIPLVSARAATPGEEGDKVTDLNQLKPELMLASPRNWCPNPTATVSLRVKGNSMSP